MNVFPPKLKVKIWLTLGTNSPPKFKAQGQAAYRAQELIIARDLGLFARRRLEAHLEGLIGSGLMSRTTRFTAV